MKINIVMGFFLPMPPDSGGATEKTWSRLAHELTLRGHEVTVVSRRWKQWPDREVCNGVRHVRLPGFDHRPKLWQNLALDLLWSLRVHRHLPAADVTVVHAVALPAWLGTLRPSAGRIVVMPGRMPKGQYRLYRRLSRVLATSTPVQERVLAENPALAPITRIYGYPIAWQALARPRRPRPTETVIGFAGRLHPEKGIALLVDAVLHLAADTTLPPWRLAICGPDSVAAGGTGAPYRARLEQKLRQNLPADRWSFRPALYQEEALAEFYRSLDVFCYPSLAEAGETFGVAVAEAMAAGVTPVVSDLACFRDFVRSEENGIVFNHRTPEAARNLAHALARLLRDPARREALAATAQADAGGYDFTRYTDTLVADFQSLIGRP